MGINVNASIWEVGWEVLEKPNSGTDTGSSINTTEYICTGHWDGSVHPQAGYSTSHNPRAISQPQGLLPSNRFYMLKAVVKIHTH